MDPLNDFEAVLSCDDGDAGDTGDQVLQGHSTVQCLTTHLQGAEFSFIAIWETE